MIIIVPIFNMFDSLFIPFDLIIQRIVNIAWTVVSERHTSVQEVSIIQL